MSQTDVLVIGGGPAGLAAAIAARLKGFDVTVVDASRPQLTNPAAKELRLPVLRYCGNSASRSRQTMRCPFAAYAFWMAERLSRQASHSDQDTRFGEHDCTRSSPIVHLSLVSACFGTRA